MRTLYARTLFYFILLILSLRASAGDSVYYQHYNVATGLPSNNIYSVIQDHNGYIWIATDKGVVKYNGYTFQLFNASTGLPANDVYQLFEDGAGRMWVSTLTAHVGFIKEDVFHELHFPDKMKTVIYPRDFQSSGGMAIFRFAYNKGVYVVTATDTIINIGYLNTTALKKDNNYVFADLGSLGEILMIDSMDVFYMSQLFLPWTLPKKIGKIRNIAKDPDKIGFVYYLDGAHRFYWTKHLLYLTNISIPEEKCIDIRSVNGDSTEIIYTADGSNGDLNVMTNKYIYQVDTNGQILSKTGNGVFDNAQISFYKKDIAGNEWYATAQNSIFVRLNSPGIIHNADLGVSSTAAYMGTVANECSFWWESRSSSLLWSRNGEHAHSLQYNGDGNLISVSWFQDSIVSLSFPNDILLFNYITGVTSSIKPRRYIYREKIYTTADRAVDEHTIRNPVDVPYKKILKHKDGSILLLHAMGVYNFFRYADGMPVVEHIANDRFADIVYEPVSAKYILYNTEKIAILDADKGNIAFITLEDLNIKGLNFISKIQTDHWGNIYMFSNENVFLCNPSAGFRFRQIKQPFNLNNSDIAVKDSSLVIAGRYGIAVARIRGKCDVGEFAYSLNIKDRYYKQVSNVWINNDGNIYLQTDHGYFSVNEDSLVADFSRYKDSHTNEIMWVLKYPNPHRIKNRDTIIVPAENKRLVFDAINFLGNGIPAYNYRIKETDENWQTSTSGEVLSDKIEPGHFYTIELQARDDVWKSHVTAFYLYRPPYWYQTQGWRVIFLILGVITVGLAITGVVSLIRRASEQAREKKRIMNELELRAIHAQINPHFIFNTLSTALYFINRKEYDNAYSHVNKFSHLLRSYLKSSHDRYMTLAEELEMLQRYIELQQQRFEFDYEFVIDNKVPAGHILIPSLLLQPLVENAINHGLFHKKEKGLLRISFEQGADNTQLVCTVDDNGVGRQESGQIKESNTVSKRESYGSRLTEKLISVFRNYEEMGISIEYIDKAYPETGTIVRLCIDNVKYQV